ncbi:MAG: hypothetical protein L0Z50_07065, partial [Verrucomicrobiales bacterium]|nr:hypothetical protein [Verrucomicrobiales bacterium]
MNTSFRRMAAIVLAVFAVSYVNLPLVQAQVNQIVFQDDFASNTIDPAKYQVDAPFFEGGQGDIHAEAGGGVLKFVGTTSQQWWSGGTLRVVPTFEATEDAPVTISIDRVAEAGVGTASRSALWILDETKTKYVLFADVRGEGGWRYNRKIGEDGDVPTGSGTDIAQFNGGAFDDGALHKMSIVANGQTVRLVLDGQQGPEVKFPFSKVVVEFGAYARANNDTSDTTWDNLKIETVVQTTVVFSDDFSSNTIDPAKFQPDAPFFEGGQGDIHAEAGNGVLKFVGTTSQQWWSGGTLRVVPTFSPSESAPVTVTIDRVAEAGVGTASRSALWILDESKTQYVLFADVRGEGGWRYNRKIGEDGDVPTGSGTDIAAFNGGTFDDGGPHVMSMVANGQTVKLILDGQVGAEVKFPFSKVIFEFGAYARANNDTSDTTWDNIKVETVAGTGPRPVFTDDFSANAIDPARYQPDAPFFEGGQGDIHAEAGNGVMKFVGTTSQQWWSGGTLRIVPTFAPSDQETITLSIDRVAEAGQGTASRSALWILDETKTSYVLFADVRAEGGWRYNRKIGEDGDVPTGSGTDIAAFNGGTFDDGALHRMSLTADGKTVKLFLDGIPGPEVKFPFSPVIFEFGSYARANNDTADTTWDNLLIVSTGKASFDSTSVSVRVGQTSPALTVRIPQGFNSQAAVQVRVVSSDPAIAVPEGSTGASLALTFPAGGPNTATFRVRGVSLGGAQFSIEGDLAGGNRLSAAVISGPGVVLEEDFASATIDNTKWQTSTQGFETGTGTFTVAASGGTLQITGATDTDFWPGASLKTAKSYVATRDLNLVFEVDRVSIEQIGTAGRTGVFITTADRSRYVFFSQNVGENNWQVNVNPGTPTGNPAGLAAFAALTDVGRNRIKLVADGQTVEVFLDGQSGGRFPFEVSTGIFFELGSYARAAGDTVTGVFDNVRAENILPCIAASPQSVTMTAADAGRQVTVTVPQLLNDAAPVVVTVTSRNPSVAVPTGAANGVLTLNFAAGAANSQTFSITPIGKGAATFDIASTPQACIAGSVSVEVVACPKTLLTDDFSGTAFDTAKWTVDSTPFDSGTATAESAATIANGQARLDVTAESSLWPGFAIYTAQSYAASQTTPLTFEIDRAKLEFVLTTGTGSEQRTGIWVKNAAGNSVFFNDYVAHDGRNFGWRYNKVTGQADDDATGGGVNIASFDGGNFDDRGQHRLKMVVNGATAKLYLDDIF